MAAQASGLKGNPAAKRMSNPNNKVRRQRNTAKNEQHKAKAHSFDNLLVPAHFNKKAQKPISEGIVSRNGLRNKIRNDEWRAIKEQNNGLGQREVRRILSGKRLYDGDVSALILVK